MPFTKVLLAVWRATGEWNLIKCRIWHNSLLENTRFSKLPPNQWAHFHISGPVEAKSLYYDPSVVHFHGGFVCLQMPLVLLSKGNKVFLLWIKGLRHTSYDVTFQPVFWLLAKQNPIIASQVANHLRKKIGYPLCTISLKKKKKKICCLKTHKLCHEWVVFSFLPTLSLQQLRVSLSLRQKHPVVCVAIIPCDMGSRGEGTGGLREKKQRIATRQGEEGGTKDGKR